jgi:glyoxylase-like metal-dependent hydrolase (beta-lactamase superfamily II)/rhodanese-related sulfurtransferase
VIFEEIATGGCRSYLVGCAENQVAAIVDPILDRAERYVATAAARGLAIQYLIDTHTHADHFSATRHLARELGAQVVMHRASPAPFVDLAVQDGDSIALGTLRLRVLHTPGHTADSMCLVLPDRVLTGDTLLLGSLGRTDLPTGNAEALWDSLHAQLFALDPDLLVHPGHNYKSSPATTLAEQRASNPRLAVPDRSAFVAEMTARNLELPRHITEALRTNASGGKPVSQLIHEAARAISFMSIAELRRRVERGARDVAIVDVREADAYAKSHVPGAIHIPRGQLELLVDRHFPDPATRVLAYCEFGKISTLAAATLRQMGFASAIALDGGFRDWVEAGAPIEPAPLV